MTYSTHDVDETALPLPIVQAARTTAQEFASQQPTPAKAAQVRLNTLAVWVVNDYLQLMGIATNLTAGDSWNPLIRLCADVADLDVTDVGRLECRPVQSQTQPCSIPPDVWQDRIGYVVVYVDESLQEAKILGFTEMPSASIALHHLRSPEDLIDHLAEQRTTVAQIDRPTIRLSDWLQGIVDAGWQTVDALLNPAQPEFAFRGLDTTAQSSSSAGTQRAKLLHFGRQSDDSLPEAQREVTIALLLDISPVADRNQPDERIIRLQVHPINQPYLPPNLQLTVLDATSIVFLDAQSRDADNYIQLEFSGEPEELFTVQVTFEGDRVTETFVI